MNKLTIEDYRRRTRRLEEKIFQIENKIIGLENAYKELFNYIKKIR